MKKLLLLSTILLITSCGLKDKCGKDIEMGCNLLFGLDPSTALEEATDRTVKKLVYDLDLQNQVNELVQLQLEAIDLKTIFNNGLINQLLNDQITQLERDTIQNAVVLLNEYGNSINELETSTMTQEEIDVEIEVLQEQVDVLNNVVGTDVEIVEVCPLINGVYKEVLIKDENDFAAFLANGSYKKERMVLLNENETYKTTDGRGAKFKIVNGNLVCLE